MDYEEEQALQERYNEMLDECNPMIKIGTLEYTPSQVLEAVDPIAYKIGLSEFSDYENLCEMCEDNEKEHPEGKWCTSCKDDYKESENE